MTRAIVVKRVGAPIVLAPGSSQAARAAKFAMEAEAAKDAAEAASALLYSRAISFGTAGVPSPGSAASNLTWAFADTVKRPSRLSRIQIVASGATTMTMKRFRKIGSAIDLAAPDKLVVPISSGYNDLTLAGEDFDLFLYQPGELVGFHYLGGFPYTVEAADGAGWYQSGGDDDEFTYAEPTTSFKMQVRITLEEVEANPTTETASVVAASATRRLLDGNMMASASWLHLVGYGQSNSVGADATPVLTTVASAHHKTFNVGPKMSKPGISGGGNPDDEAIKALVEDDESPIGSGTYGETHLSSTVREYTRRALLRAPGIQTWFASSAGLSSTPIVDLMDASVWYQNLLYHMTAAKREANALGLTYAVAAITWDHGETDQLNSLSKSDYKSYARALFDAIAKDVAQITGQSAPPHFLFTTSPYHVTTSDGASQALMELSRERPDVHFVAPGYRYPHANGTHLSNVGQVLKGADYGRALDDLACGRQPDCIEWMNAVASGTTLNVYARAPTALQINTSILGAATDNGVKVSDGTGTLTLSGMAVTDLGVDSASGMRLTRLSMTLNRTLGTNPVFRYAKDFLGSGLSITSGASGNIFDTTAETITIDGNVYSMAHAAPPITLSIVAAE